MKNQRRMSSAIPFFAVCLAFLVVILGAYTRATDAGLGCPDWPGCYHRLIAPETSDQIQQVKTNFPNATVHVAKAWTEMVHRYMAGALASLIIVIALLALMKRKTRGQPLLIPFLLVATVIFQALLGMWTVTLRLEPQIVLGHLLGGMTILSLLWWLFLYLRVQPASRKSAKGLKIWSALGLIIVALQIALGGWTSANYAALVCPNFPYCNMQMFFPSSNFPAAFNVFAHFSMVHLQQAALITIQMTHRFGALVTGIYIGLLSIYLIFLGKTSTFRWLGFFILLFLCLQISLGIMNVMLLLPLTIAIAHNAVAALLLLSLVTLNYSVFRRNL
jgi:cytochrome c oxidase assembly protein subunit 15